VRANPGSFNAAVWALDTWWLKNTVINRDEVIPPADPSTIVGDRDKVSRWIPERFGKASGQVAVPLSAQLMQEDATAGTWRHSLTSL
jgi:hypothetical protein